MYIKTPLYTNYPSVASVVCAVVTQKCHFMTIHMLWPWDAPKYVLINMMTLEHIWRHLIHIEWNGMTFGDESDSVYDGDSRLQNINVAKFWRVL